LTGQTLTDGLLGIATLAVALASLYIARRTHRTEKESFLIDIRREWDALRRDWNLVLLYLYGPENYYPQVDRQDRERHKKFVAAVDPQLKTPTDYNEEIWRWAREERATVARAARFFAYASDALLTGRWTVREAYALFGPDVARHFKVILWMAHRLDADAAVPAGGPRPSKNWLGQMIQLTEYSTHDQHDALVVIGFVLRAEQCRRGDLHSYHVADLADDLRGQWGPSLKNELRRASHARGRHVSRLSLRLAVHRSTHPWKRSAFEFEGDGTVRAPRWHLFQRPYESVRGNAVRIERISREAEFR
jgi:hypothetical protein